jgi:dynein heavy chain
MVRLEDDQMTVGNCMGSKFVVDIRPQVEEWEKRLSTISDVIDEWLTFQKTWMYLENIFGADDIQKQLPKETKMFMQVDKFWKELMIRSKKNPIVMDTCDSQVLLGKFQNYNGMLDEIGTCLANYLETKRGAFPRFYFLSDGDLLEILSQTRNAQAVQPHLGKCFDNMVRVEFAPGKNSNEILAMISSEGENVRFSSPVYAQGPVEEWLTKIEEMMRLTLYDKQV